MERDFLENKTLRAGEIVFGNWYMCLVGVKSFHLTNC